MLSSYSIYVFVSIYLYIILGIAYISPDSKRHVNMKEFYAVGMIFDDGLGIYICIILNDIYI